MAYNTVYMLSDEEPVAKYVKTIPSRLTGFRFGPQGEPRTEFCISADDPEHDYDNSVLEIYTDREHKYVKGANRKLFEQGLLKPYTGAPAELNTANYMSDDEVMRIASLRRQAQLEEAIDPITSYATLNRVFLQAQENGMSKKMLDLIEAKMARVRDEQ
jgi:hypothetical protein